MKQNNRFLLDVDVNLVYIVILFLFFVYTECVVFVLDIQMLVVIFLLHEFGRKFYNSFSLSTQTSFATQLL